MAAESRAGRRRGEPARDDVQRQAPRYPVSRFVFSRRTARTPPGAASAALFFGWVKDPEPRFEIGDPRIRVQSYALYRVIVPLAERRKNESRAARKPRGFLLRRTRSAGLFLPAALSRAGRVPGALSRRHWARRCGAARATSPKVCSSAAVVLDRLFRAAGGEPGICAMALQAARALAARAAGSRPASSRGARWRFSSCMSSVSLLLIAPLLVWAAAISRVRRLPAWLASLALIPFYALCYGVWGLVALVLWERKPENRELIVRCFIVVVVVASLAVYLPLNPVAYLLAVLGSRSRRHLPSPDQVAGRQLSISRFHLALGGAGLAAHRWALKRGLVSLDTEQGNAASPNLPAARLGEAQTARSDAHRGAVLCVPRGAGSAALRFPFARPEPGRHRWRSSSLLTPFLLYHAALARPGYGAGAGGARQDAPSRRARHHGVGTPAAQ